MRLLYLPRTKIFLSQAIAAIIIYDYGSRVFTSRPDISSPVTHMNHLEVLKNPWPYPRPNRIHWSMTQASVLFKYCDSTVWSRLRITVPDSSSRWPVNGDQYLLNEYVRFFHFILWGLFCFSLTYDTKFQMHRKGSVKSEVSFSSCLPSLRQWLGPMSYFLKTLNIYQCIQKRPQVGGRIIDYFTASLCTPELFVKCIHIPFNIGKGGTLRIIVWVCIQSYLVDKHWVSGLPQQ